jgi:glutamine synthetase
MHGKPSEQPRRALARQTKRAADLGYSVRTGVEYEFFLRSRDGSAIGDAGYHQSKPCYDQLALMRR